ncbi:MAG TPA: nuclear transport factor 2 family protein [Terriglobales bacterium]|nr:nuclear transport factor 2 family protein [Terriglobales bacterium]
MSSSRSTIYFALIICLGTAVSSFSSAATGSNAKPEDQVMQVERDWLAADAKGDTPSLRRLISDDFIGSSFNGEVLSKEDIIPDGTGPGGFAGATPGETNVRVFGDTGVLMGVIHTASGPQSKPIRVTLVCQKRPQGWQIIAAQLARM